MAKNWNNLLKNFIYLKVLPWKTKRLIFATQCSHMSQFTTKNYIHALKKKKESEKKETFGALGIIYAIYISYWFIRDCCVSPPYILSWLNDWQLNLTLIIAMKRQNTCRTSSTINKYDNSEPDASVDKMIRVNQIIIIIIEYIINFNNKSLTNSVNYGL